MPDTSEQPKTLIQCQAIYQRLASTLAAIGFIWPGTLQQLMLTCGKPRCACHRDPGARHGPYWYWTSKKAGKTISKKLTPKEAAIIGEWIENRRRLDRVVKEMMQESGRAFSLLLREPDPPA